ncbi:MAG: FliA/WhiG family RNA polymerase sigma factor [Clostridia bacterium]|nr:FliA/WhiG family RNA polymerase sigma factor [Clostridia bacterium]
MEDISVLWAQYRESGSQAVRETLILNYMGLVKFIVSRMPQASIPGVDYDDLMGYGVLGLMDAVERYDLKRGVKFETYAMTRIRGAIIDHLRNMDWVPRSVRQRAREIEKAMWKLETQLDRPATDDDIAAELRVDVATLEKWMWEISKASYLSLDELIAVDEESNAATLLDFVSDIGSPDPEMVLEIEELKNALIDAIDSLPERERMVIAMYYYEEMTVKEIAQVMRVSESRVSQLHTKAMMRLRAKVDQGRQVSVER